MTAFEATGFDRLLAIRRLDDEQRNSRHMHGKRRKELRQLNAERLVDIVESSMSSPVYELLKRPDELFVVEHAHLQPRFVEDSVRIALATTLERFPELADDDFLYSRQVNLETIHSHDVLAERYGTVGELRGGAVGRHDSFAPHEPRHVAA